METPGTIIMGCFCAKIFLILQLISSEGKKIDWKIELFYRWPLTSQKIYWNQILSSDTPKESKKSSKFRIFIEDAKQFLEPNHYNVKYLVPHRTMELLTCLKIIVEQIFFNTRRHFYGCPSLYDIRNSNKVWQNLIGSIKILIRSLVFFECWCCQYILMLVIKIFKVQHKIGEL